MIYLPFIAAFALASINLFERLVLKKKNIAIKPYMVIVFLSSVIIMLPFLYFFWNASQEAFSLRTILIFSLIILFSIIANLFNFFSLKWEKLSNLQPAKMMEPLFTVLLALLFSFFIDSGIYERNFNVIIPALIASCVLIFSHIKKHHLDFNKYVVAMILASFFYALELILSRLILEYYSPISFYFLRCFGIFLISLLIFRPKFSQHLNKKLTLQIFFTGFLYFIFRVAVYYGYIYLGIVSTTLVTMLAPILVYIFATIFLKEKLTWRNILASIIILACVIYVSFS